MRVFLTALLLASTPFTLAAQEGTKTREAIFDENRMAIVRVSMKLDSPNPNQNENAGSGFIISGDGFVLTAKHVLSGYVDQDKTPVRVRIGSLDGIDVAAEPLQFDIGIDVVLLKLRSPIGVGLTAYRVVQRGDSTQLKTGQSLVIVGFNFSSNISAVPATLASNFGGGVGGNLLWGVNAPGALFGMSGGAVFDKNGRVVAIVKGGQPGASIAQVYPEQLLENFAVIPGWKRTLAASPNTANRVAAGTAIVMDGNVNYEQSTFNFAKNQILPWGSIDADIGVATADRIGVSQFFLPYDVPPYTSPGDVNAHSGIRAVEAPDLAAVTSCPATDYQFHFSPARQGGIYCIRLRSGSSFAKIKVTGVFKDRISFDWELLK